MRQTFSYDYIIIGSGPAGSILANNLATHGSKVALIERASNKRFVGNKNSYIFSPYINKCPNFYTPQFSDQLGGNSVLWNNKIFLISEDEFNKFNWGFTYNELKKYSLDLSSKLNIDHNSINYVEENAELKLSSSKREKKLGNIFKFLKIKENNNIDLYYPYSPVEIKTQENYAKQLKIVKENSKDEIFLKIKKALILCAGGLGNPNLINNLLPNSSKLTGKNLCDHPHINISRFSKKDSKEFSHFAKYFLRKKMDLYEKNAYLEKNKIFAGIQMDLHEDPLKHLKKIYISIQSINLKKFFLFFILIYDYVFKIFKKFMSLFKIGYKYSFEFFFSQSLNQNNSVSLNTSNKDKYGLFKSDINLSFSDDDIKTYNELVELFFKEKIKNKNIKYKKFNVEKILIGLHPSCTTIIGDNISNGCVDKDLNLFGYKNVFVSGSSVFKTNGFTNPTWTIMTLSNRLSFYLQKNF